MAEQEQIDNQLALLALHRRTLAIHLKQLAQLGALHASPGLFHSIEESRANIRRVKSILRIWFVSFEDHPDDEGEQVFSKTVVSRKIFSTARVTDIHGNTFTVDAITVRVGGCDFVILDDTEIELHGVEALDFIELIHTNRWFIARTEARLIDGAIVRGEITFTEKPFLRANSSFLTIDTALENIKRIRFSD